MADFVETCKQHISGPNSTIVNCQKYKYQGQNSYGIVSNEYYGDNGNPFETTNYDANAKKIPGASELPPKKCYPKGDGVQCDKYDANGRITESSIFSSDGKLVSN